MIARSGTPYSLVSGQDLNMDGSRFTDRLFVDGRDSGRNSFRQPSCTSLDLRVGKAFGLGGERQLEVAADLFNALDNENRFVSNRSFDDTPPPASQTPGRRAPNRSAQPASAVLKS